MQKDVSLYKGTDFPILVLTRSFIAGFGDLVPGDSVISEGGSQEKLVMCSLYLLFGMALIAMCFNLMQEEVIHKVRTCGRRIGILKDTEGDDDDMG